MKDFQLRNDTRLLLRHDPRPDLALLTAHKKVLLVYGGTSVKDNGCYADVQSAVSQGGGTLCELSGASRELSEVQRGIAQVKEQSIELIIGVGGAQVMDCAKLIALGCCHEQDLWDFVKMRKDPYGQAKLPLILMPTYPSSGSEYGLGAVCTDERTGDFGCAYGIAADTALLVPKYAFTLGRELTAYTGLVTLVQLCAAILGDHNPVSYDIGIAVIRRVLEATRTLQHEPLDEDARGVILYGAALSTSGTLGLGKEDNYAYEIYELEFIPEVLFKASYRHSLTTIFPRFLLAQSACHAEDVRRLLTDAFGFEGPVDDSVQRLVDLFAGLGVSMYFEGQASESAIAQVPVHGSLDAKQIALLIRSCLKES
ncbi:MAG: iron-containing alcohol dehydrogenase [Succinivibrio sp.]|nr:iron-containing alcohol dehydrogenase [Succinivibrio sp.]